MKLLQEREYLAAAALASRGQTQRHPYEAQWTPEDYQLDYIRGMALYHLSAYREAADSLADFVVSNPNDVTAHYYLGAALFRGGNKQAAEVHLEAASQISLSDPLGDQALARLQEMRSNQAPNFPNP